MTISEPIFVLGDINVDALMPIDSFPSPGEDKRSERTVVETGGSAANSAILLAKFGLDVEMVGCVGQDVLADFALEGLRREGVGTAYVQRTREDGTGMMFVPVTPDGQRTLFGRRGANRLLSPKTLPIGALRNGNALHLSGYAFIEGSQVQAAQRALVAARKAAVFVSLDTAYEPPLVAGAVLRQAIRDGLDLLVLGEKEVAALTGSEDLENAGRELLKLGARRVAVKRGAAGSMLFDGSNRWSLPILPVETIDTTGAGDSYSAALLYGLLRGLSLPAAGVLATAAGALATAVWGAGTRVPQPEQIRSLLEARLPVDDPTFDRAAPEALQALPPTLPSGHRPTL